MTEKKTVKGILYRLVGQYLYKKDADQAKARAKQKHAHVRSTKLGAGHGVWVGD